MHKLYVVGIGPGKKAGMTAEADAAIEKSKTIIGYSKYIELVRPYYPDKEFLDTGMTKETERCGLALRLAQQGDSVALICSGDAGVYGMAGLIYELAEKTNDVEITVIPGVTAALSGGALLGAPLGHDFAVISLSDRLTPFELIEKRLILAAQADMCISLYNPASHGRPEHLKRACDILLRVIPPETVCGVARNIGREGEAAYVLTLGELRDTPADMFSTVFIGNSSTRNIGGKMVTPRGYRHV